MTESILLIETPDKCTDCELCDRVDILSECYCVHMMKNIEDTHAKPNWCPLQPLPEKAMTYKDLKKGYAIDIIDNARAEGWNACIDAILNGKGTEK